MRYKITLVSSRWSGTEYVEANTLPEAYEKAFSNEYVRLAKLRPMTTPRRITTVEEDELLPFENGAEDENYPSVDAIECPRCKGQGWHWNVDAGFQCKRCKGTGRILTPEIPAQE